MTAVFLLQFFAALMIVGGTIRVVEHKWPDSMVGRALGVAY